jgi:ribosomal protein S18 acetylase RimI-like enzyme
MAIRMMRLPVDLLPLADVVSESFQYPENESWSVQTDEKEQIVSTMRGFYRLWPIIGLIQALSPTLRDLVRGCVWEEDGRIVGTTLVQRRGSTDLWEIGDVGVLPSYRRRGIARKLMIATLDMIRERGGKRAILGVIDGNLPACRLYQELGFEQYGRMIEFEMKLDAIPPGPSLPQGYTQSLLGAFDWRPRFELEKRTTPQSLTRYEPVVEGRFCPPAMMRLLRPVALLAQGTRDRRFIVRDLAGGKIVSLGRFNASTRGKGVNQIDIFLDPEHPDLAPYMVAYLLHGVMTLSPGLRIECSVPNWMEDVVQAVEVAGFKRRMEGHLMGIEL